MLNNIDVKLHSRPGGSVRDVTLHRLATTLKDRWRELREETGLGMNAFDRYCKISASGGYTSRVEAGDKLDPNLDVINRVATATGVRAAWLAFGEGAKRGGDPVADTSAGTFLLRLDRIPKLREAIESDPSRWRVSTVITAMTGTYESDSAGVPHGGWARILDGIEAGKDMQRLGAGRSVLADTKKQIGRRPKLPSRTRE